MERNMFLEAVKTEQRRIQRFIDLSGPEQNSRGSLYLRSQGDSVYAYERWQRKGQPERRVYLGPLASAPVRELFSCKFKEQRLARLCHDQRLLEKLEQQYQMYDFESVVNDMPKAYRRAARANSYNQRYEELLEWANADYAKNPYPFPEGKNFAKDGTRMRSKGECIWYNLMQERGILFRNDCEVVIVDQNGQLKTLFADFLIQCFDGTFIIIEHLGKMGDMPYAVNFGEKSYWYFQKGFILGKNFFVTSDDSHYGTDSQMITRLVDRIEEMFFGF